MALPSYSEITDLVKKGLTLEAQEKIMELREAVLQLQEENLQLRQQNQALQQKLDLRNLAWDGIVYWLRLPDQNDLTTADPHNGPFCPHCCDKDAKRIRLHRNDDQETGWKGWFCKACEKEFWYEKPPLPRGTGQVTPYW